MPFYQVVIIAVGLAMDAFAVSVASGAIIRPVRVRHAFRIAAFFGFFQALMPCVGWQLGQWTHSHARAYDHWIAFGLLALIGIKMILEARRGDGGRKDRNPLVLYMLFLLAVATSIDALAVGVSFSFLGVSILGPAVTIGIITFALSYAGTHAGGYFGHLFEDKLEIAGGVILIAIGLKILIEHTMR